MSIAITLLVGSAISAATTTISSQFPVTPYSNSTQAGFKAINISTYGHFRVVIGPMLYNVTQNFISPNESGVTINNVSYNLFEGSPVGIAGSNTSYVELMKVNYVPRLHSVDFNIYTLQPASTTTTTAVTSLSTTSIMPTTTLASTSTTTSSSTTTMPQGIAAGVSVALGRIIAFFRGLFSFHA